MIVGFVSIYVGFRDLHPTYPFSKNVEFENVGWVKRSVTQHPPSQNVGSVEPSVTQHPPSLVTQHPPLELELNFNSITLKDVNCTCN